MKEDISYRKFSQTFVGKSLVTTVLDDCVSPRVFRTYVFGGPLHKTESSYLTPMEAGRGHVEMVLRARKAQGLWASVLRFIRREKR